jgi:hypothetical protein
MIIESFTLYNFYNTVSGKEYLKDGWDTESVFTIIVFIIWIILWIITLVHIITCSKQSRPRLKRVDPGIILAALSWPFYWLYYITGTICIK